jgi:hypothetical protein
MFLSGTFGQIAPRPFRPAPAFDGCEQHSVRAKQDRRNKEDRDGIDKVGLKRRQEKGKPWKKWC